MTWSRTNFGINRIENYIPIMQLKTIQIDRFLFDPTSQAHNFNETRKLTNRTVFKSMMNLAQNIIIWFLNCDQLCQITHALFIIISFKSEIVYLKILTDTYMYWYYIIVYIILLIQIQSIKMINNLKANCESNNCPEK